MPPIIDFSCEGTCRSWDRASRIDTQVCNHFVLIVIKNYIPSTILVSCNENAQFVMPIFAISFFFFSTCFFVSPFHVFFIATSANLGDVCACNNLFVCKVGTRCRIYYRSKNFFAMHGSLVLEH